MTTFKNTLYTALGLVSSIVYSQPTTTHSESHQALFGVQSFTQITSEIQKPNSLQTPISSNLSYTETINGQTLDVHSNGKVASLKISAAEFAKWKDGSTGFNNNDDRNGISKALYQFVKDDFDFIFFINNLDTKPSTISYYGQLISVSRDIEGISQWGNYDNTSTAGSSGKLQSTIHLPYLKAIQQGPTLHELAHNWANFFKDFEMANPNGNYPALPHFGWTGIPGQLGGFDPKTLVDLGSNSYQANNGRVGSTSFGGNANGGNGLPYSNWELYLMGLAPKDSLSDIIYFEDVVTTSELYAEGKFSGTKKTYSVSNFINDRGERIPAFGSSQTNFNCLFVVLTDSDLSDSQWMDASEQVDWLIYKGEDQSTLFNFYEATNGVGSLTANILPSLKNGNFSSSSVTTSSSSEINPVLDPTQQGLYKSGGKWMFNANEKMEVTLFNASGSQSQKLNLQKGVNTLPESNSIQFIRYQAQGDWKVEKLGL